MSLLLLPFVGSASNQDDHVSNIQKHRADRWPGVITNTETKAFTSTHINTTSIRRDMKNTDDLILLLLSR